MKKFNHKILFLLSLFLYKISLDSIYCFIISPQYSYLGLSTDINSFKIIETYFIILILGSVINSKIRRPSDFFMIFLLNLLVIPILTIYSFKNESRLFVYYIIISFLIINFLSKKIILKIKYLENGDRIIRKIALSSVLFVGVWFLIKGDINNLNFNLRNVYDFREANQEIFFPGRLQYFVGWIGKSINIFLIIYGIWKKEKKIVIFSIFFQIIFFAITAHKSYLFYPIVILTVYYFSKTPLFPYFIQLGFFSIACLSTVYYVITDNIIFISLFIRRVLLVTANNHFRYYNVFSHFGYLFYSNKPWFPSFIDYPLKYPVPEYISLIYYGDINTWVNTGFLARGYIHFGFIGMIIYSIIIALVFNVINSIKFSGVPNWVAICIPLISIYNLRSADLPTTLLSHGLILSLILLWFVGNRKNERYINDKR